jgi:anti-sigma factor RsiW
MAAPHIDEDDLELYALGRLAQAQAAPVEEHLLVCETCRARLAEWDGYTRAMREAMRRAAVNPR